MLMRPSAETEEGYEKMWKTSDFWTDKDFHELYDKWITASQHVIECAKIYCIKNWEKVNDWSGLNVIIRDNTGTSTEYYNYAPNPRLDIKPSPNRGGSDAERGIKRPRPVRSDVLDKMLRESDARDKAKHNPITSISGIVLDPTDGDFSLTINGRDHLWIDGEAIIEIADYIEQKLKVEVKKEDIKTETP